MIQIHLSHPKMREDESTLPPPVVKTDPSTFENYLRDASNFKGHAAAVYIPHSEKQISEILMECSSKKIPVTIESAHTGLTGAGVPVGGVALSVEKLTRVSEIKNSSICVDSGVVLKDLHHISESKGFLYTPDPTEWSAFLGGTVATNASGPRTFKYGATRPHVKRMRIVLSNGGVLDLSRGQYRLGTDRKVELNSSDVGGIAFEVPLYAMPDIKNVAGYYVKPQMDLIDLFIGSEGTLGVITELELQFIRLPEAFFSIVAFFRTEEDAVRFVIDARRTEHARALEYLDSFTLRLLESKYPQIPKDANAAIFLEQECTDSNEDGLLEDWLELMTKHRALTDKSWIGMTREKQEEFRLFRHEAPVMINEIMARRGLRKVGTDMAVPDSQLETMMKYYKETIQASGIDSITFGHIGNNHLHVNLLPKSKEEFDRAWALYHKWIERVIQLGGTVSAEHGIGKIKVPFLEMMYGPQAVKEMAALKQALDPAGILGQGNIFSEKYLKKGSDPGV